MNRFELDDRLKVIAQEAMSEAKTEGDQMENVIDSPARGPKGGLRNLKQMGDEKLIDLHRQMQNSDDVEGFGAVAHELNVRKLVVDVPAPLDVTEDPETPPEPEGLSDRRKRIVNEIRKYAQQPEQYEKGWAVIVETMQDEEIADLTGKTRTFDAARKRVAKYVKLHREAQEEAQAA